MSWITWLFYLVSAASLAHILLLPQPLPTLHIELLLFPQWTRFCSLLGPSHSFRALFWHPNPSPIIFIKKRKSSHFLSCQSYILSQISLSQQPHKVDSFIIIRQASFTKLPNIAQFINGRARSKPRQFGSRILHFC